MDESAVSEYVDRSESVVENAPQMDEQNTKAKLVQPLIELLGWDVYSPEVELEYTMQIGRQTNNHADYALVLEGTPVVFVEAKGCDSTLTDPDRRQLKSYMRQVGVDWGLLTNGKRFEVFKRRTASERPDEVSLGTATLAELPRRIDLLGLLSKESVRSGESDRIAETIEATREAISVLRREKDPLAERVTDVVSDEVCDVLSPKIESEAKEFIDRLIASLEDDHHVERMVPSDSSAKRVVPANSDDRDETTPRKPTDPEEVAEEQNYRTVLRNGENRIGVLGDGKQSDAMVAVVERLVEDHGLINELRPLPYVPGRTKALINDDTMYGNDQEMRQPKWLPGGYYLDTNLNKQQKQRRITQLAETCGLTVDFEGDW